MKITKSILITSIILLSLSCNNSETNVTETTQPEVQNPAETRRIELVKKVNNNTINLIEQKELDSLDNEKYIEELKNAVLNMTKED